jgi:hypothetical protein
VPKGEVSGTITINGKSQKIHGYGYHDHQWGSNMYLSLWNHWLWARQGFDNYSVLLFDLNANKKYNYKRFPIMFIQDKNGKIIFENTENVKYEILEEYQDEKSGKFYPKTSRYTFDNNGKRVEYTLSENQILENFNVAQDGKKIGIAIKLIAKVLGLKPSYTRYSAIGTLKIYEAGKETIERTGNLIYEFMYPSKSYKIN